MKPFVWDPDKNEWLKRERGISFERVVLHIEEGDLVDILEHLNPQRYPGQRILVVRVEEYVYLVPCLEIEDTIVLKTIIPSRKLTKQYLHKGSDNG
jgi:putative transposon-encoded protein